MNKWTIKRLNETDDITFAMCILSERQAGLNSNAPLSQKIAKTLIMLEKIRGGCPVAADDCLDIIRERIYLEVDREHIVEKIKERLEEKSGDEVYGYNLHGLTIDEIFADNEIMKCIISRVGNCECRDGFWDDLDLAINQSINDIIESR